ncbi:type II secretion system protein [Geomonas limicola]
MTDPNISTAAESARRVSWAVSDQRGFTLVELLMVCIILAALAIMIFPAYAQIKIKVQNVRAMEEIRSIEKSISAYTLDHAGTYPTDLQALNLGTMKDPWGTLYVYHPPLAPYPDPNDAEVTGPFNIAGKSLSDDFDLYSKGPDGHTSPDATDLVSLDNIVRVSEGGWVGVASDFVP